MKALTWLWGGGAFPRYLLVGIGTSLLDFALFTLLAAGVGIPAVVSNVVSTLITVCVSYFINRSFVFRSDSHSWAGFFSFAGVTLFTGLVLQSLLISGFLAVADAVLPQLAPSVVIPLSKVCAMGIAALINYLSYRFVFRPSTEGDTES